MPANNTVDWSCIADCVAMFDATEGEAENALKAILVTLKKKGLKFADAIESEGYKKAVWKKFKPEGLREWIEWKDGKHGGRMKPGSTSCARKTPS
jgi:hypothetical protein